MVRLVSFVARLEVVYQNYTLALPDTPSCGGWPLGNLYGLN
ncbi:MAG TPA: hypothetical protein VJ951_01190 [Bacteroidales bacterium]|nr:hypothetical protein [Bacteroidales bacterium]